MEDERDENEDQTDVEESEHDKGEVLENNETTNFDVTYDLDNIFLSC